MIRGPLYLDFLVSYAIHDFLGSLGFRSLIIVVVGAGRFARLTGMKFEALMSK
jgi:hypothetical protein